MSARTQMRVVRQQCDYSCGVACAAMVAGVSFGEARARCGEIGNGMSARELGTLLRSLHVRYERLLFPEITKTLPHIVVVPSLNHVAGNHYVVLYFDGRWNVLDPQRDRRGMKWYALHRDDATGVQLRSYSELIRVVSPVFKMAEPHLR